MTNYNDGDGGIIMGRWDGKFTGGTRPTAWVGSIEILNQFDRKKKSVKYGQCWVFAGVLCTLLRTLGIPCRVVSNFESAHDTDQSITIDHLFDKDGNPLLESNDSVWNFHVWNEIWLKRPDLPAGHDGWQVVDATPQEASQGFFQLGPAPISAIKEGDLYLPYDCSFVFSEVNGPSVYWTRDEKGRHKVDYIDLFAIGKNISTKAIGSDKRSDLTSNYKYKDGSKKERQVTARAFAFSSRRQEPQLAAEFENNNHNISVKLQMPRKTLIGHDFEMGVLLSNDSDRPISAELTVSARIVFYTGISPAKIDDWRFSLPLAAGEEKISKINIKASEYLPPMSLCACETALKVYARAKTEFQTVFVQEAFDFDKPVIDIQLSNSSPKVGETVKITLSLENPLPVPLTGAAFSVEGLGESHVWNLKYLFYYHLKQPLSPNWRTIFEETITPRKSGKRTLIVGFHSNELSGLVQKMSVKVTK